MIRVTAIIEILHGASGIMRGIGKTVKCFGWENKTYEFYVPIELYCECDETCRHDGPKRTFCGARTEVIYNSCGIVVAAFS